MSRENNLNPKTWKQIQSDLDPGFHSLFHRITQLAAGLEFNNLPGWNLDGISRLGMTCMEGKNRIRIRWDINSGEEDAGREVRIVL